MNAERMEFIVERVAKDEEWVLVTGNGFDLHHCLPTRYVDFLDVVNRLMELDKEGKLQNCQWLAYILGDQSPLYGSNEMIRKCYDVHRDVINSTQLDEEKLQNMVDLAKENMWMQYFSYEDFRNVGWIDFEKEISRVIKAFQDMIVGMNKHCKQGDIVYVEESELSPENYHIVTHKAFETFFSEDGLKEEYWHIQRDADEAIYLSVNEQCLAGKLYVELDTFITILDWYITEFIQKISVNKQSNNKLFSMCDRVITFNYTDTFSLLYDKEHIKTISYVHGSALGDNIVLGINDDENDQLKTLNLAFVEFKKYYQRTYKKTDYDYERILPQGGKYQLHFVGHSMDVTDSDILKLLIKDEKVQKSVIYYHDDKSHGQVIKNVIALFGKDEFEELRRKHKIEFKELDGFAPSVI